MPRRTLCALVLGGCALALAPGCRPSAPNQVRFTIDMRPALEAGWFDPDGETVGIRGGTAPLSWQRTLPALDEDGDGRYEVAVSFSMTPADSLVEYKFKVDGTDNPNDGWEEGRNRRVVLGGRRSSVRRVFNEAPPPLPKTHTGTIHTHAAVPSAWLDDPRDVFVYLPPGYDDDPGRRYPVLYLHDGQNVFDASSVGAEWGVDETAERLIRAGAIEPVIVVGVGNTPARLGEYTPTRRVWRHTLVRVEDGPPAPDPPGALAGTYQIVGDSAGRFVLTQRDGALYARLPFEDAEVPVTQAEGGALFIPGPSITLHATEKIGGRVRRFLASRPPEGGRGDAYGRFLVEELKPFIDRTYRTLDGPAHTALGGSSLGGLVTMYLGLLYPDVFGTLLVVSPAAWWDDGVLVRRVEAVASRNDQSIWLDMGTEEGDLMLEGARRLRDALTGKGWRQGRDLVYVEAEGAAHNERAWARRVEAMLRFAFPAGPGA